MEEAASSPALRVALALQTTTLSDELVDGVRTRTRTADDSAERRLRSWLRTPARVTADA